MVLEPVCRSLEAALGRGRLYAGSVCDAAPACGPEGTGTPRPKSPPARRGHSPAANPPAESDVRAGQTLPDAPPLWHISAPDRPSPEGRMLVAGSITPPRRALA